MAATGFNDEGADEHQVKFISRVGLQLQMLIFLLMVNTNQVCNCSVNSIFSLTVNTNHDNQCKFLVSLQH